MFALNIVLIVLISYQVSSFIPHTTRLSLNSFSRCKQGPKYNWQSATTSINGIENGRNGGMNGGNGLKGVVNGLDGGVNGGVNGGNVENEGNRGNEDANGGANGGIETLSGHNDVKQQQQLVLRDNNSKPRAISNLKSPPKHPKIYYKWDSSGLKLNLFGEYCEYLCCSCAAHDDAASVLLFTPLMYSSYNPSHTTPNPTTPQNLYTPNPTRCLLRFRGNLPGARLVRSPKVHPNLNPPNEESLPPRRGHLQGLGC